jgi:aspartate racemase
MLGVLGGMGPLATADFMQKLISVTPSINDQNHIPAVVWSVPQVADRSEFILNGLEDPFPMLLNGVNKLKSVGACVIAIPCNTAHFWADKLADETRIHILHMADAVAIQVKALLPDGGKVGLLATE